MENKRATVVAVDAVLVVVVAVACVAVVACVAATVLAAASAGQLFALAAAHCRQPWLGLSRVQPGL